MDPKALKNRLLLASSLWREATRETAREVAAKTWDLVHDRPDDDPVKQRVVRCHDELARLASGRDAE